MEPVEVSTRESYAEGLMRVDNRHVIVNLFVKVILLKQNLCEVCKCRITWNKLLTTSGVTSTSEYILGDAYLKPYVGFMYFR